MDDILIFANPISGRGRGVALAEALRGRLEGEGFAVRLVLDRAGSLPPERCVAAAAVVIGGDGTIREVAERLHGEEADGTGAPLLVVPLGTANLMGRHLGLPWRGDRAEELLEQVSAALHRRRVVQLDAATLNGRLFLLMAGIGLDAQVIHELERLRRGAISLASYAAPVALALGRYRHVPMRVEVDGGVVFEGEPAMCFIGNAREYGTGFPLLPYARTDDGVLDVCVIPCRSGWQVLQLLLHAAAGEHTEAEGVVYIKGRQIGVEAMRPLPIQVDGEAAGHTPAEVRLLRRRVPFIVAAP